MNPAAITTIIFGVLGALLAGMAALIKAMVIGRLDGIQETLEGVRTEIHEIDLRVTKLEAEHHMCYMGRRRGDTE